MRVRTFLTLACFSLLAVPAAADTPQDAAAVWPMVSQPAFDPGKSATVENLTLARDRIRITLAEGTIQFTAPAGDRVFGAAFRGRGRVEIAPPNDLEKQQLRLHTGQDSLAMEFSEAAFSFSDDTFEEISKQVKWGASGEASLARLYQSRQQNREDVGAELVPRLFKSLLSADRARTSLFLADLKTREKDWIHVRFDALEPEEITVGRWTNWGGATLFDTWLSFPAGNRSAAEAFRDPLARADFTVRGYQINAQVTDGSELSATTKVNLEHRVAGERVLLFLLDGTLRVESVKDESGAALPFFQPRDPKDRNQSYGDYIAVILSEAARTGQVQTLEFHYAGKRVIRKVGPGSFFCQSFGWYPTRENSFATRADFELVFRSPKKYTLVATGNKLDETTDGNWKITSWKSDLPLAVAGFAFGDYKITTQKVGEIDVEIYANREPDDEMRSIERAFSGGGLPVTPGTSQTPAAAIGSLSPARLTPVMATELSNTLRVFQMYFGPYPYKRLALTNIPYSYGQGWPMLIYLSALSFLDSTQRNALGIRDHTGLTDFFRAHESSHQWWGHRVGWKSYHDQWLSEGFAQFSGNLYVQFRKSEQEYLVQLRKDREDFISARDDKNRPYESLGAIWMGLRLASSDSPRGYAQVIYNKGGFVLHMLRRMMVNPMSQEPDQRFIAMMRDFCQTHHNRAASTEDFKAIVEKYMLPAMDLDGNRKMDWFFRQYVYGTGVPQYNFRYQIDPAEGGRWKVTATLLQSNVPDGWMDVLSLYAQQPGGRVTRLGLIGVVQRESKIEFVLPSKPDKLLLNYNEDTLADIKQ